MNTINKILYKLFGVIIIFAYNTNTEATETTDYTHEICAKGYYISKCGNKSVETKWLKKLTVGEQTYDDYYDYSIENAEQKNIQNFQKWFEGTMFTYIGKDNIEHKVNDNDTTNRDGKLQYFCNPTTTTITCEKCPGSGTTETISSVEIDDDGNLTNWVVNSKVNCYIDTFFDQAGSYEYKVNNETQKCYYTDTVTSQSKYNY